MSGKRDLLSIDDLSPDDVGQLLSGTFQDYAMPRAADLPEIHSEMIEVLSTTPA